MHEENKRISLKVESRLLLYVTMKLKKMILFYNHNNIFL